MSLFDYFSQKDNPSSSFSETDFDNEKKDFPIFSTFFMNENVPVPYYFLNEEENKNNIFEEEKSEKDLNKLYFVNTEDNKQYKHSNIFEVRIEKENNKSLIKKKRKRGRQIENLNSKRCHYSYCTDNLICKIQVNYISFIISFLNEILEILNYKERFYELDYNFKKQVNQKYLNEMKEKSIRDIISNKISEKYKNKDKYSNRILCEKLKEDKKLNKLLSDDYLNLFEKIYLKSQTKINLEEYGLDKEIILSNKVKMFNSLLLKVEDKDTLQRYLENIINVIKKNFLPNYYKKMNF